MSYHPSPLLLRASTRNTTRTHTRHTTHTYPYLKRTRTRLAATQVQIKVAHQANKEKAQHTNQKLYFSLLPQPHPPPCYQRTTRDLLSSYNHETVRCFLLPADAATTSYCASTRGGADDHAKNTAHAGTHARNIGGSRFFFRPVTTRPSATSAARPSAAYAKERKANHILTHTPRFVAFIGQPVNDAVYAAVDANKRTHTEHRHFLHRPADKERGCRRQSTETRTKKHLSMFVLH
ncbi:unnamed protein product [Ectocarpus sp. 4 AP-2014]